MTDQEITRLCMAAMEIPEAMIEKDGKWYYGYKNCYGPEYDPLHDDKQAMELVKKLRLFVGGNSDQWMVQPQADASVVAWGADLNRAICECVASMQSNRTVRHK